MYWLRETTLYPILAPQLMWIKILEICAAVLLVLALLTLLAWWVHAAESDRTQQWRRASCHLSCGEKEIICHHNSGIGAINVKDYTTLHTVSHR